MKVSLIIICVVFSFSFGYFLNRIFSPPQPDFRPEPKVQKEVKPHERSVKKSTISRTSNVSSIHYPEFIAKELEVKNLDIGNLTTEQWNSFKRLMAFEFLYNLKSETGWYFSDFAIANNEYSVIDGFSEAGIDLNIINKRGILPIVHAAEYSSFDFFEYLISIGVEVPLDSNLDPNNNIIRAASENKNIDERNKILEYLNALSFGFKDDEDKFFSTMKSSLYIEDNKNYLSKVSVYEEKEKKINILELMIKNGASNELLAYFPEDKIQELCNGERSFSALHALALNKEVSESNILRIIENCKDINAQGFLGVTPLMYAVKFRNLNYVKLLIGNGADVQVKDNSGRIAYDYIKKSPLPISKSEQIFLEKKLNRNLHEERN